MKLIWKKHFHEKPWKFCFRKWKEKIGVRNIIIINSPVQTIHEISLEYEFADPIFEVVQCNLSNHIPIFVAIC